MTEIGRYCALVTGGPGAESGTLRERLRAPGWAVAVGLGWIVAGTFQLFGNRTASGALFLVLGFVSLVSGCIRHVEQSRDQQFGGVLGALAWLTRPMSWRRGGRGGDR